MAASTTRAQAQMRQTIAPLNQLILTRIVVAEGATRSDILRDVGALVAHRLSPGEWRQAAENGLQDLIASGLINEKRGRFAAAPGGMTAAAVFLGYSGAVAPDWAVQCEIRLTAKALHIETESVGALKVLARPEGLRRLIVQKAFGLPIKPKQSSAQLRSALAVVALERAFGNKIKSAFGGRDGLPSKAARLLAGQLSRSPRDFGSDSKLIAALAAEQSGAAQSDSGSVRTAILKTFVANLLGGAAASPDPVKPQPPASAMVVARAANDAQPLAPQSSPARTKSMPRPDLSGFVAEVQASARKRSEGWPGNRKAFISDVWHAIRVSRADWGLTEIEFKCMLAEAHRAGQLVLSAADLKDKKNLEALRDSAIPYKNTVWHFVRVEE